VITKTSQRGGGRQLASHLLNQFDNERVDVLDLRGSVAKDLHGAFQEWHVQSKGTRAEKYLYSMSINPWADKYTLTQEQYLDFIGRTERALKLSDQPRAVVRHVKDGREHFHVVWSRIDTEAGKARQISFDRMKLRAVVRDFARDHGLELPRGLRDERNREADRFNEHAKRLDLGEAQQEKRTGLTKEDRMPAILRAWNDSRDGHAFVQALEKEGFLIAAGDQRDYVVIDRAGEIHSLTKQLKGTVRARDVKDRLAADFPKEKLRSIDETRKLIADRERERAERELARRHQEIMRRQKADALRARQEAVRREHLQSRQQERRAAIEADRAALATRVAAERGALLVMQKQHTDFVLASRAEKQPGRIMGFLRRITGLQAFDERMRSKEDKGRDALHKRQLQALDERHDREARDIRRRERDLKALEVRENAGLDQTLKRETFLRAINRPREITPDFTRAAEPETARERQDGDGRDGPRFDPGDLSAAFRRRMARKEIEEREDDRTPRGRGPDRER
jgi:hypothetical protein